MCHEKNKDKKEMMEDIKSLEKRALKLKKMWEEKVKRDMKLKNMWEEKVKRDKEALEARGRGIREKMPKAAGKKTESNADEETEDKSSTKTLVCTFLKCIFKVFLIMCWLRRRLPQTQAPFSYFAFSVSISVRTLGPRS